MLDIRARMDKLEKEIEGFSNKYAGVTPEDFPLEEFKSFSAHLRDLYEEMGSADSDIHIEEGKAWHNKNTSVLRALLP